jgi:hypothetical protein
MVQGIKIIKKGTDNVLLVGILGPLIFLKIKVHPQLHSYYAHKTVKKNQQLAQRAVTILVRCKLTSELWWDCMCTECNLLFKKINK